MKTRKVIRAKPGSFRHGLYKTFYLFIFILNKRWHFDDKISLCNSSKFLRIRPNALKVLQEITDDERNYLGRNNGE